jgi:hypothetical protein
VVVGDTLELNKGTANLAGGVVRVGDIEIDNGVMNIEASEHNGGPPGLGGKLILDGNKFPKIWDLVNSGKLTGCGSARGIVIDWGGTNPGKTTVTSTCGINFCQAWAPDPPDGATEVRPGLATGGITLCWNEGDCLGVQGRNAVYFGTDFSDVNDATTTDPIFLGWIPPFPYGEPCRNVGILPLWETYYWRVDQYNKVAGNPPVTKGRVWRFTTGCELIEGDLNMDCLVNFLDFAELASTFGQEDFWPE